MLFSLARKCFQLYGEPGNESVCCCISQRDVVLVIDRGNNNVVLLSQLELINDRFTQPECESF